MLQTPNRQPRSPLGLPSTMERLRYPAEPSRLAMAVVCVACALAVVVVWLAIIDVSAPDFRGGSDW